MTGGQQQAAAEVMHRYESGGRWDGCPACATRTEVIWPIVESIRAEAARPGQELRARVEALADKYDDGTVIGMTVANTLRAALENPR